MFAPDTSVLIGARAVLGLGTCAGYPAATSLLRREADRTGNDNPGEVLTALGGPLSTVVARGLGRFAA